MHAFEYNSCCSLVLFCVFSWHVKTMYYLIHRFQYISESWCWKCRVSKSCFTSCSVSVLYISDLLLPFFVSHFHTILCSLYLIAVREGNTSFCQILDELIPCCFSVCASAVMLYAVRYFTVAGGRSWMSWTLSMQ